MGVPDELITTVLDTEPFAATRRAAIEVHRTQYSPLDRMPSEEFEAEFLNRDYFIGVDPPAAAKSGVATNDELEHDLFEGLDI